MEIGETLEVTTAAEWRAWLQANAATASGAPRCKNACAISRSHTQAPLACGLCQPLHPRARLMNATSAACAHAKAASGAPVATSHNFRVAPAAIPTVRAMTVRRESRWR